MNRHFSVTLAAMLLAPLAALPAQTPPSVVPAATFTRIHAISSAPPVRTATQSLRGFLDRRGGSAEIRVSSNEADAAKPVAGSIILGTTADSPSLARWVKEGRLAIRADRAVGDAYELAMLDGCVAVNGANARAVLYGVFELQDVIAEHGGVPTDLARRAAASLRLRLLHPRVRSGFGGYRQIDFEFLARCGGNVAHLMHDWMAEKTLFSFVPSTEFPKAADRKALEQNRSRLHQYLDWCGLYGLDGAMWLCEVPCQGGPWVPETSRKAFLDRFPAEMPLGHGHLPGQGAVPRPPTGRAGVSPHGPAVSHRLSRHLDVPRVYTRFER